MFATRLIILGQDESDGDIAGVNQENDREICGIIDGMKGGSRRDSDLQGIKSVLLGSVPNERSVFAVEIDERSSKEGIVGNPDVHSSTET